MGVYALYVDAGYEDTDHGKSVDIMKWALEVGLRTRGRGAFRPGRQSGLLCLGIPIALTGTCSSQPATRTAVWLRWGVVRSPRPSSLLNENRAALMSIHETAALVYTAGPPQ